MRTFAHMKKRTIWAIASVMGSIMLALLFMQFRYLEDVYDMRKEQFSEAVNRSLSQVALDLELRETMQRLEGQLADTRTSSDTLRQLYGVWMGREPGAQPNIPPFSPDGMSEADSAAQAQHEKRIATRLLATLYRPSEKTLTQRINFKTLDSDLIRQFAINGISNKLHFHFRVLTSDGREVYRCQDYDEKGEEKAYRQELFPNDERAQMGVVCVHFPQMDDYLLYGVRFMIPALIFTLLIIIIFAFTVYTIFRQKRLSEIKNDFINNMTHEFKTPISTISLAAQMLSDPSITKSESMFRHVSGIIIDETKRLRFLVEKVLQMSMFDRKAATFKPREANGNSITRDVVNTFRLKVESAGGTIEAEFGAENDAIYVDEMHFTNVIFNLLDNAVKYKKADESLCLHIKTQTHAGRFIISIEDNGIGIKRDDLKKIFEKFYRVHTGNRHDVKGFGLGLAYVKNVIDNLDGTITADSEFGKGTKFTITLPLINLQEK